MRVFWHYAGETEPLVSAVDGDLWINTGHADTVAVNYMLVEQRLVVEAVAVGVFQLSQDQVNRSEE